MQSFVQMYLEERRSVGFALEVPGNLLMGFACFSDQRGHRGPITEQLILDCDQKRIELSDEQVTQDKCRRSCDEVVVRGQVYKYRKSFNSFSRMNNHLTSIPQPHPE